MTEEQKRNLAEAMRRYWAAMPPEERERRRAEGSKWGKKSAATMTPERRAAMIARTQTPEARAHNAAAIAKRKAELTAEDPDWLRKIMREKWSRHDPETEAQRRKRSENSKRMIEGWAPEQRAAFIEAGQRAHRKPVEGTPVDGTGEVVRFDSAGSAAKWVLSTGGGTSYIGARHTIYDALAGRRETAYGHVWRHCDK